MSSVDILKHKHNDHLSSTDVSFSEIFESHTTDDATLSLYLRTAELVTRELRNFSRVVAIVALVLGLGELPLVIEHHSHSTVCFLLEPAFVAS